MVHTVLCTDKFPGMQYSCQPLTILLNLTGLAVLICMMSDVLTRRFGYATTLMLDILLRFSASVISYSSYIQMLPELFFKEVPHGKNYEPSIDSHVYMSVQVSSKKLFQQQ